MLARHNIFGIYAVFPNNEKENYQYSYFNIKDFGYTSEHIPELIKQISTNIRQLKPQWTTSADDW